MHLDTGIALLLSLPIQNVLDRLQGLNRKEGMTYQLKKFGHLASFSIRQLKKRFVLYQRRANRPYGRVLLGLSCLETSYWRLWSRWKPKQHFLPLRQPFDPACRAN